MSDKNTGNRVEVSEYTGYETAVQKNLEMQRVQVELKSKNGVQA